MSINALYENITDIQTQIKKALFRVGREEFNQPIALKSTQLAHPKEKVLVYEIKYTEQSDLTGLMFFLTPMLTIQALIELNGKWYECPYIPLDDMEYEKLTERAHFLLSLEKV